MQNLDIDRLLKLRLVVARFGEMDLARWWNTKGQLGRLGTTALRRGFPRTHFFAQARSVFAVAAHRCDELFSPPMCVSLWRLPEAVEEEFDARWERWVDDPEAWEEFFRALNAVEITDLVGMLRSFDLVDDADADLCAKLGRSAEGRAVPIPGVFSATNADITLLALGFAHGEIGAPAVPYMRTEYA
jgi:hypothetical protein